MREENPETFRTAVRVSPPLKPQHDAKALTGGGREAEITLDDKVYTLRITRQGKLILTK